jgi:hypothetical protein
MVEGIKYKVKGNPNVEEPNFTRRTECSVSTLYLIPYTLYLIPYTLYLIPYTLYLIPYTLYLIPSNLQLWKIKFWAYIISRR